MEAMSRWGVDQARLLRLKTRADNKLAGEVAPTRTLCLLKGGELNPARGREVGAFCVINPNGEKTERPHGKKEDWGVRRAVIRVPTSDLEGGETFWKGGNCIY